MNIRNQKLIREYIKRKTSFLGEEWYYSDILDTSDYFVVINDIWWEGGFDPCCPPKEKECFYKITQEALEFIIDYAKSLDEKFCCIGPFHGYENYENWTNKNEYDSFNALSEYIKNDEYAIIDFETNQGLLGLIIENNFRYLSKISIYLPKSDILIEPEKHTQIFIYAKDCKSIEVGLNKIVTDKGWKQIQDTKDTGDGSKPLK